MKRLSLIVMVCACDSDVELARLPDGPAPAQCPVDESVDGLSATRLEDGQWAEGHVCPIGDADFFLFTAPAASDVVLVELLNDVPLTAVDLQYSLLDSAAETALATAGDEDGSDGETAIAHHHVATPTARYVLVVRDDGNNEQDVRNGYQVRVTGGTNPDTNEPNDTPETATELAESASGYIASLGDIDVYSTEIPASSLVRVRLSASDIATGLSLGGVDAAGSPFVDLEDPTGALLGEGIESLRSVPAAGTYFLAVRSWDGVAEDFDTPYTIEATLIPEPDPNEGPDRNDGPETATPLFGGATFTGPGAVGDQIPDGRIASAGDQDWYGLDVGVSGAILDVTLDGPAPLEWALQLLAPDAETSCVQDSECVHLSQVCTADWQCLSSTCVDEGGGPCEGGVCHCQGAGVCLPDGICAVAQFARTVAGGTVLETSQPLLSDGTFYLVVSDQGGDEWDGAAYVLDVALRLDPDAAEPDNDYDPYPLTDSPAEPSLCDPDDPGGCAARVLGIGATGTGYLAYESDFDYFRLDLPCCDVACPCAGTADVCSLVLEFGTDAGPVDPVWELFGGSSDGADYWGGFDPILVPDGVIGDDECLIYTKFLDITDGEAVYVRVRDDVEDGADWSASQTYYVRLASASPGCPAGCSEECTDICGEPCTAPGEPAGCCDHDPAGTPAVCDAPDGGVPDGADGGSPTDGSTPDV